MLSLPSSTRVFVYRDQVDMRCSFDGLSALVSTVLREDPVSGHLFVFLNRPRTHVKILYFDRTGYAIWYKRLEQGTFTRSEQAEIDYRELVCVLEGIENPRRKKRYFHQKIDGKDVQST